MGALFLLEAIAFAKIVTAVIASSFMERAHQARVADTDTTEAVNADLLAAQLSEISARLERIERALDSAGSTGATPG